MTPAAQQVFHDAFTAVARHVQARYGVAVEEVEIPSPSKGISMGDASSWGGGSTTRSGCFS
jgi:hypothetical protein